MPETKSLSPSPKDDIKKDYEAVQMLKTESDDADDEKGQVTNNDSEKQVTFRRLEPMWFHSASL